MCLIQDPKKAGQVHLTLARPICDVYLPVMYLINNRNILYFLDRYAFV